MTDKKYIIALDQGTTSSRAVLLDHNANVVEIAQREFTQIYPRAGWVEHNPMEIWATQSSTLNEVVAKAGITSDEIAAIGITNQRETTIVWEKATGTPVYNAIVWQGRRTADITDKLKADGHEEYIRNTTGLVVDPYFSGTKVKWILDNVEGAREKAERGELLFGTVDTWLVWKLTQGRVHVTAVCVFLLPVSRVTNKRHFTAIYALAQAKQKIPMVQAALCCFIPVIKPLPLKMAY